MEAGYEMSLFIEQRVFRHAGDSVTVYVCFQDLRTGQFAVQQAETFAAGDMSVHARRIGAQTLELFLEESPAIRSDWFGSLAEAIRDHDDAFA